MIRSYQPEDTNFIFKCWLKSYREQISRCPNDVYYKYQQRVIARLTQSPSVRVAVCCDADSPSFIMGFCVAESLVTSDLQEPLCIHFAFVKLAYRRNGILTYMMRSHGWEPGRPVMLSHWTRATWAVIQGGKFTVQANPYAAMDVGYRYEASADDDIPCEIQDAEDVPMGEIT